MSNVKSLRIIIIGGCTLLLLFGYNFIGAQWTPAPPGIPPAGNTSPPINVSSVTQNKNGTLGVNALGVFGMSSFSGTSTFSAPSVFSEIATFKGSNTGQTKSSIEIQSGAPSIKLTDTSAGETDWWIRSANKNMYFINDRNDDGTWANEEPWPFAIYASTTGNHGDYIKTYEVRADKYCSPSGTNCLKRLPVCPPGSILTTDSRGDWVCGKLDPIPVNLFLFSNKNTEAGCVIAGGVVNGSGTNKFCRFDTDICPATWTQYLNWSATRDRTTGEETICGSRPTAPSCIPGQHNWGNVAIESCTYTDTLACAVPTSVKLDATVIDIGCY